MEPRNGLYVIFLGFCGVLFTSTVCAATGGDPAAFLDGDKAHITASLPESLGGSFTVEMWMFATAVDSDFAIASFGSDFQPPIIEIALGNPGAGHAGKLELQVTNSESEGGVLRTDADRLSASRWTHLAVVVDDQADGLLSGQALAILYFDGAVKAQGIVPRPATASRERYYFGRSLVGRPSLSGIMDDIRVWSVARTPAQIKASIFRQLGQRASSDGAVAAASNSGLLLSLPLNVTAGEDVGALGRAPATLQELVLRARTGAIPSVRLVNLANSTLPDGSETEAPRLHCESTACVVPVPPPRQRVLCGDGRRFPGLEECDTGGSLDGCTADCKVRAGFLCSGGEDLQSPDTCVRGSIVFQDGFETESNAASWKWDEETATDDRTAMGRAAWSTAPEFKAGGEAGLRLRVDARNLHEGCEPLISPVGGIFVSGAQPAQDTDSAANFVSAGSVSSGPGRHTAIVSWPITGTDAQLSSLAVDPPRSGRVLQLGSTAELDSEATTYYAVGPAPGIVDNADAIRAPTGAISLRFRVSCLVMVQPNQFSSGYEYDGDRDLLDLILMDADGDVVPTRRLTPTTAAFPSRPGRWERIVLDIEVVGGPTQRGKVADFEARFGRAMRSTKGLVWMTDLSVVRHCPGLPPGPAMWLRADRPGVPLTDGQIVTQWTDYSGQGANALAPQSSKAPVVKLGTDGAAGLPVIRFDGVDDQLGFDESSVKLERPNTIFLLARYVEGTGLRREILQGIQERQINCHYYSRVGLYMRSSWMFQEDIPSTEMYKFQLCVTQMRRDYNGFRWQGRQRAMVRSYLNEPLGLSMGGPGYSNSPSHADVAEMIVYRRELSDQEIVNVEHYLAKKWGLGSILPAGHRQEIVPYGYESALHAQIQAADLRSAEAAALSGSSSSTDSESTDDGSDFQVGGLSPLAPTGGNELDTDANPVIAPVAGEHGTVDFFQTRRLETSLLAEPWRHIAWGRRTVIGLDTSAVLTMKVNVRRQPFYAGYALQVIVADAAGRDEQGTAAAQLPAYHECFQRRTGCGSLRVIRLCVNAGAHLGGCDDVQDVPLREWRTITIPVAQKIRAIYGANTRAPTAVAVMLAAAAPEGVSEVYVDDVSVVRLNETSVLAPGSGGSNLTATSLAAEPTAVAGQCPRYAAYSLASTSRTRALSLRATESGSGSNFDSFWTSRAASGSIGAAVVSAGTQSTGSSAAQDQILSISGTVPSSAAALGDNLLLSAAGGLANSEIVRQTIGQADPRSASAYSTEAFSRNRIETVSIAALSGTQTAADAVPKVELCGGEVALQYSPADSQWKYALSSGGLADPPSTFIHIKVDDDGDGTADDEEWSTGEKQRNLGKIIPFDEECTYTFDFRVDAIQRYWTQLFQRGSNADGYSYVQDDGADTRVSGGADRQPAVFLRYNQPRLHIRQATRTNWNHGCDPLHIMTLRRWTHYAIVTTMTGMRVYVDGDLECSTSFGVNNPRWNDGVARDFWTQTGHYTRERLNRIRDFRYYSSGLTSLQVRGIGVRELKEAAGSPTFCPATGNFYLYVASQQAAGASVVFTRGGVSDETASAADPDLQPGILYSDAATEAEQLVFQGSRGHLATLTSGPERECVAALLAAPGCARAWVSGRLQSNQWRFDAGPEAQSRVPSHAISWATGASPASEPSGGQGEVHLLMHPTKCSAEGGSRLGQLGDCTASCIGVRGYIVEFPAPDRLVRSHGAYDAGARIVASSPLIASTDIGGGGLLAGLSYTDATDRMKRNVLMSEDQWLPWLRNGEASFIFANRGSSSGSSTGAQYVVVDLGSVKQITRVRALLSTADRDLDDYIEVQTSTTSSSSGWSNFGRIGEKDGNKFLDPAPTEVTVVPDPLGRVAAAGSSGVQVTEYGSVAARWVRVEFGVQTDGSSNGGRLEGLRIEEVQRSIARLEQQVSGEPAVELGTEQSISTASLSASAYFRSDALAPTDGQSAAAALVVSVVNGTSGSQKLAAEYNMSSTTSQLAFASDIRDVAKDGDVVLVASRDLAGGGDLLFEDQFDSVLSNIDVLRTTYRDPGLGVYPQVEGYTYGEAEEFCAAQGRMLCPRSHLCRPEYPSWPGGVPHYGWNLDGKSYVAVREGWLAMGTAFSRPNELCNLHIENEGRRATDTEERSWLNSRVMCCETAPKAPRWKAIEYGVRNSTGRNNNENGDSRYPSYWRIINSQLRHYGYTWGHPSYSGWDVYSRSWSEERCRDKLGVSALVLDEPQAYQWTDIRVESIFFQHWRGIGAFLRWVDTDNYYSVQFDREMGCLRFFRVIDGEPTRLGDSIQVSMSRGQWHMMEVSIVGGRLELRFNGEVVGAAVDSDYPAEGHPRLRRGTIALTTWMGWYTYWQSVRVYRSTTADAGIASNVTSALRSIGAHSQAGVFGASWSIVGRKGATPGTVPLAVDGDAGLAEASTVFPCEEQRAVVAEASRDGAVVPVPVAVQAGSDARSFAARLESQVSSSSSSGQQQQVSEPFGADSSSGQLFVRDSSALDAERTSTLRVSVTAQDSGWDSGWFKMGSQAGQWSRVELPHGLGSSPSQLLVTATVRPLQRSMRGYEIPMTGTTFSSDWSWINTYGGVQIALSAERVRLFAPTRYQGAPSGAIVQVGRGWGGLYENGAWQKEAHDIHEHLADVRVRISKLPPPDFDSGWSQMFSRAGSASFRQYNLPSGGREVSRVRVLVRADSGPMKGYVIEASGSAQSDDDIWTNQIVGAVFAWSDTSVRVWVPSTTSRTGTIAGLSAGWSDNPAMVSELDQASVKVLAWYGLVKEDVDGSESADVGSEAAASAKRNHPAVPDYDSGFFTMIANQDSYRDIQHGLGETPGRVHVVATPTTGSNLGFFFEGQGMAQSSQRLTYHDAGGVLFGYTSDRIRLFAPSPLEEGSAFPSSSRGFLTYVTDGWGGNTFGEAQRGGDVRVRIWKAASLAAGRLSPAELSALSKQVDGVDGVVIQPGSGGGVSTDATIINILVQNVAEAPSASAEQVQLPENPTNGSIIGSIQPSDGDCAVPNAAESGAFSGSGACAGMLSFRIVSGNDDNALHISSSGDIVVLNASALDYEARRVVAVSVEVSDGSLSTFVQPAFRLIDSNDPPIVESATVSVLEESPVNSKVGVPLNATDQDLGQVLTWEITEGNIDNAFKIGTCDGQIRVRRRSAIDYEQIKNFTLTVMVTDDHPTNPLNATAEVIVLLINVNDPPELRAQTIYVSENTPVGGNLGVPIRGFDQDGDMLRYYVLAGDDRSQFDLINATGQLTVAREGFLDYEADESLNVGRFALQVGASDGEFTAVAEVTVVVIDAQDAPIFNPSPQQQLLSVPENSLPGVEAGTLTGSDQDVNDTLSWHLISTKPAQISDVIEIVESTGEVRVSSGAAFFPSVLNHEDLAGSGRSLGGVASLLVEVRDSGGNMHDPNGTMSTYANISLAVQDVPEPPIFYLEDGSDGLAAHGEVVANVSIEENQPFGTSIVQLRVFDEDTNDVADQSARGLQMEIVDGDIDGIFAAGATASYPFNITVRRPALDFETKAVHILTVRVFEDSTQGDGDTGGADDGLSGVGDPTNNGTDAAADGGQSDVLNATAVVIINLLNRNDPARIVCNRSLEGRYEWRGGDGYDAALSLMANPFDPASADGTLTFQLGIRTDDGDAVLTNPLLELGQTAESDQLWPRVDLARRYACREACARQPSCAGFTYVSLSYEVPALRGACVGRNAFSERLVYDLDETGGRWAEAKTVVCFEAWTDENAGTGSAVLQPTLQVSAADDEGDAVFFAMDNGTDSLPSSAVRQGARLFSVGRTTGILSVQTLAALNHEQLGNPRNPGLVLARVVAEDSGASGLVGAAWVAAHVRDLEEPPALVATETQRRQAAEESPQGTQFAPPVGAFDEDFNDTIAFAIQGTDHSLFDIDEVSGMLFATNQLPSLATSTDYQLTVRMTDTTGLTTDATVTITVADVNNGPVFSNLGSSRAVDENSAAGTPVVGPAITATDADGNSIVFAIFSGPSDPQTGEPLFEIDNSTGIVSAAGPISFERRSSYTLTISATDRPADLSTAITTHGSIVVSVRDVPEAPRVVGSLDLREQSVSRSPAGDVIVRVAENSGAGALGVSSDLDRPIWFDEDLAPTNVTYSVVSVNAASRAPVGLWGGTSGGAVAASALQAALLVRDGGDVSPPAEDSVRPSRYHRMEFALAPGADASVLLNHEIQSSFDVVVEASDLSGQSSQVTFSLYVEDRPEPPSVLEASLSVPEQDNGGAAGVVVGVIEATDPDNSTSFLWSISQNFRVGGADAFAITTEASADPERPGLVRGVLVLLPGARIDYEDLTSLVVEVEVRDSTSPATWLTARRRFVVQVIDVDDLSVLSVSVMSQGADGDDDGELSLQAEFPTRGCGGLQCVRLTGQNMGPTRAFLDREGNADVPDVTLQFGGTGGTRYSAMNCSVVRSEGKGNEEMLCSIPAGVGRDHPLRVTYGAWSFLSSSSVGVVTGGGNGAEPDGALYGRISYKSPSLSRAELLSSDAGGLDTVGGGEFFVHGDNFGPTDEAQEISNVSLAYRLIGQTPTYAAAQCTVDVNHVRLRCRAAPGVGESHDFAVRIGGQQSHWTTLSDFRYRRPLLSALTIDGSSAIPVDPDAAFEYGSAPLGTAAEDSTLPALRLRAAGGTSVLLRGRFFGPSGDGHAVVGVFAPQGAFDAAGGNLQSLAVDGLAQLQQNQQPWFLTAPCAIDEAHESVRCSTPPGVGTGLVWYLLVANQISAVVAPNSTSYESPFVSTVTGPGARNGSTAGSEDVYVDGVFGPPREDLPAGVVSRIQARYGPMPGLGLTATNCSVLDAAGTRLLCSSAPGSGRDHSWRITVSLCARDPLGGSSDALPGTCSGASSEVNHAMTAYAPPVIAQIYGAGASSPTEGGVEVRVRGANLGPSDSTVDFVGFELLDGSLQEEEGQDAAAGQATVSTLSPATFDLASWATEVALEYMGLRTATGSPSQLGPGGRLGSVLPLHLPELYGEISSSGSEGSVPLSPDETPVHLPRGPAAWDVSSRCRMVEPHAELLCVMPAGAGSLLRWQVIVAGQRSVQPQYGYKPPSILAVRRVVPSSGMPGDPGYTYNTGSSSPQDMDTIGSEWIEIEGENFGASELELDSVRYGPYRMRDCAMVRSHAAIHCRTVPGVGQRHSVFVTVREQQSAPSTVTVTSRTDTRAGTLSYLPPTLSALAPLDSDGERANPLGFHATEGGVVMQLIGSGFGPPGSGTWVSFGEGGGPCAAISTSDGDGLSDGNTTISSGDGSTGSSSSPTPRSSCAQVTHVNDTLLFFATPEGQGANVPVTVVSGGIRSADTELYSYSAPDLLRLTVLQREELDELLASRAANSQGSRRLSQLVRGRSLQLGTNSLYLYASGSNFGPSPVVSVTDILDNSVTRDVFPVEGGFRSHSEIIVSVEAQEGAVRIVAGNQRSNPAKTFSQASPVIVSVERREGRDGGVVVAPGRTEGGWRVRMRVRNMGKVRSSTSAPTVVASIRGTDAVCDNLPGDLVSDGLGGTVFQIDDQADGGYDVRGDSIVEGTLWCTVPPGFGEDAPILVRHGNADDASSPARVAYDPPANLGFETLQGLTGLVDDVRAGDVLMVRGTHLSAGGSWNPILDARDPNEINPNEDISSIGEIEPVVRVYFTDLASGDVSEATPTDVSVVEAHERISFVVPPLAGEVAVTVEVAEQRQASVAAAGAGVVSSSTSPLSSFQDGRDGRQSLGMRFAPPSFAMRGDTTGSTVGGAGSGAIIALDGSGFGRQFDDSGNEIGWVTVGGSRTECFSWNDTAIRCYPPASQGESQEIVVHTAGGSQTSGTAGPDQRFDYLPPRLDVALSGGPWEFGTKALERRGDAIARAAGHADTELEALARAASAMEVSTSGNADDDMIRAMVSVRGSDLGLEGTVYLGNDVRMVWSRQGNIVLEGGSSSRRRLQDQTYAAETQHADGSGFRGGGIVSWTHDQVVFQLPEGQGTDLPLLLESGISGRGQQSATAEEELRVSYAAPQLASLSPLSVPTDGCYQWERVTAANRGADPATGLPVRLCCQPSLVEIRGRNLGVNPTVTIAGVRLTVADHSCDAMFEARNGSPPPAQPSGANPVLSRRLMAADHQVALADSYEVQWAEGQLRALQSIGTAGGASVNAEVVGTQCSAACEDPVTRLRNPLLCGAQASQCCRYAAFPSGLDDIDSCPCPVAAGACILSANHDSISIRPPGGFGANASLAVDVGGQTVGDSAFGFDAPEIRRVTPFPHDARGDGLVIEGKNLGSNDPNVSLAIGGIDCDELRWTVDPRGLSAQGLPYLECASPADTAGDKNATVDVGGMVTLVDAEEQSFVAVCLPETYGLDGEYCLPCPEGGSCPGYGVDPPSIFGWWRQELTVPNRVCPDERQPPLASPIRNGTCPNFIPCQPPDACLGNNECAEGYDGVRCALCVQGTHYRLDGECVECPDNPLLILILGLTAAIVAAIVAYVLNKGNVSVAVLSISVDFLQVLAIFAKSRVQFPPLIRSVLQVFSAFNLNLELVAPECSIPDLDYRFKWFAVVLLPLGAAVLFLLMHLYLIVYKYCWLQRRGDKVYRHAPNLLSAGLTAAYFMYLFEVRTVFDIFSCSPTTPPDGRVYMQSVFVPCWEKGSMQMQLFPWALVFTFLYALGFPGVVGYIMNRGRDAFPQYLYHLAKGSKFDKRFERKAYALSKTFRRLIYFFKPRFYYWILVVIARKALVACTALFFQRNPALQMSMALLVLFVAYTLQVVYNPFMSEHDKDEVAEAWERRQETKEREKRLKEQAAAREKLAALKAGGGAGKRGAGISKPASSSSSSSGGGEEVGEGKTGSAESEDSGVHFANPLAAARAKGGKAAAGAPTLLGSSEEAGTSTVHTVNSSQLAMVERTRALEEKRRRAYRRQSMRSAKRRGKEIEGRDERDLRLQYSLDYNRLEASLLSASIFVCLCGVMFASNRFEDDDHFVEQRDALTYICIMVIVLALMAVFFAFLYEVVVGLRPESRKWFLTWLVYTGKIPPAHDDEEDKIQLQSALSADGTHDDDDNSPALTQAEWEQFKTDYAAAQTQLERAQDRLEAERASASTMGSAGSAAVAGSTANPLASRRAGGFASKLRTGVKAKFRQRQLAGGVKGGTGSALRAARRPRGSVLQSSSADGKKRTTSQVLAAVAAGVDNETRASPAVIGGGVGLGASLKKLREEAAREEAEAAAAAGGEGEEGGGEA